MVDAESHAYENTTMFEVRVQFTTLSLYVSIPTGEIRRFVRVIFNRCKYERNMLMFDMNENIFILYINISQ